MSSSYNLSFDLNLTINFCRLCRKAAQRLTFLGFCLWWGSGASRLNLTLCLCLCFSLHSLQSCLSNSLSCLSCSRCLTLAVSSVSKIMSCRESRGPASSWLLLVVVYESLVVSREVETTSGDETSGEVDSGGGASGEWSVSTAVGDGRGLACAGVHGERLGKPELSTEGDEVRGLGELHETGEDFGHEAAGGL